MNHRQQQQQQQQSGHEYSDIRQGRVATDFGRISHPKSALGPQESITGGFGRAAYDRHDTPDPLDETIEMGHVPNEKDLMKQREIEAAVSQPIESAAQKISEELEAAQMGMQLGDFYGDKSLHPSKIIDDRETVKPHEVRLAFDEQESNTEMS